MPLSLQLSRKFFVSFSVKNLLNYLWLHSGIFSMYSFLVVFVEAFYL